MKKQRSIEFERNGITCYVEEKLAILKMNCDGFDSLKNTENDREILDWFDLVAQDDRINGVLTINAPGCFSDSAYKRFLSEVSGKSIDDIELHGVTKFENTQIRSIEINMLMNFIRKIVAFPKITITGLRGEVVTPFIGLSLAGDIRIMEEGSSFNFSHLKYAIHPSAGLPFFLPLFVGQGKAMEILLTGGVINSGRALDMTLANKILPAENFEKECIEHAKKMCGLNLQLIKTTKNLSNNFRIELDRFFEKESNFMLR